MTENRERPPAELATKAKSLKQKFEAAMQNPDVRDAFEPGARTAMNAAIAVADVFPVVGEVASWGADAAKIYARIERKKEAEVKGVDPESLPLSKWDLTPDVRTEVAVFTEFLELFSAGTFPTHAIEGGLQLYHDWPKLKRAAEVIYAHLQGRVDVSEKEAEAAHVFDVELKDDPEV